MMLEYKYILRLSMPKYEHSTHHWLQLLKISQFNSQKHTVQPDHQLTTVIVILVILIIIVVTIEQVKDFVNNFTQLSI